MKRLLSITALAVLCLLLTTAASASTKDELRTEMENVLTEIYGYTEEDVKDFTIEVTENAKDVDYFLITAYPNAHPDWIYSGRSRAYSSRIDWDSLTIPFTSADRTSYPGQNSVMDGLRLLEQSSWLKGCTATERNEVQEKLYSFYGVSVSIGLKMVMADENSSPADLVHEFLLSCYGSMSGWSQPLMDWHDELIASLGADPADYHGLPELGENISYTYNIATNGMVELSNTELPASLSDLSDVPPLQGWSYLCGAVAMSSFRSSGSTALLIYEREGLRQVIVGQQERPDQPWAFRTAGTSCVLPDVPVDVVYGGMYFNLRMMPKADCLVTLRVSTGSYEDYGFYARLDSLQIEDSDENMKLSISDSDSGWHCEAVRDGAWYDVSLNCALPQRLSLLQAAELPLTVEGWQSCTMGQLPEGCVVAKGAVLRSDHSSHSKDQGTPVAGAVAQCTETRMGTAAPWYHVRIGSLNGWLSSPYVDEKLTNLIPLVARVKRDSRLAERTGWFAPTVPVDQGTELYVLMADGNTCYVCVPDGNLTWPMGIEGRYGYISKNDLQIVPDVAQLDWLD